MLCQEGGWIFSSVWPRGSVLGWNFSLPPAVVVLNFASVGTYSAASLEFSFLIPPTDFRISAQSFITRFPRKFGVQALQPKCCFCYCLGGLDGNWWGRKAKLKIPAWIQQSRAVGGWGLLPPQILLTGAGSDRSRVGGWLRTDRRQV